MDRLHREYLCGSGHWTGQLKLNRPIPPLARCPHLSHGEPCRSELHQVGAGSRSGD